MKAVRCERVAYDYWGSYSCYNKAELKIKIKLLGNLGYQKKYVCKTCKETDYSEAVIISHIDKEDKDEQ